MMQPSGRRSQCAFLLSGTSCGHSNMRDFGNRWTRFVTGLTLKSCGQQEMLRGESGEGDPMNY